MPKEQTHFILAEKAAEAAGSCAAARAIARAPKLYLIGSVIMDTPMYALAEKEQCLPLTERLHGKHGENPFIDVARVLKRWGERYPDEALSFCMGVVSHVMADASFHPFVFYVSGDCHHPLDSVRARCLARHRRVETLLDTLFVNSYKARTFYKLCSGAELPPDELRAMAGTLFGVSGPGWSRRIKLMMSCHCALQATFLKHPASRLVHLGAKIFYERFMSLDALFYPYDGKKPGLSPDLGLAYRHPVTGLDRKRSINRLGQRAAQSAAEIFQRVSKRRGAGEAAEFLAGIRAPSPETGLPGVSASEMKVFDTGIDIESLFAVSGGR